MFRIEIYRGENGLKWPEVSLIHRYPSASEPGHDVGIFMLELK
jgi:hypothetical protein